MAINKELFAKVRDYILEESRRYDQGDVGKVVSKHRAPCGTVGCLAWWADFLENGTKPVDPNTEDVMDHWDEVQARARIALGLTNEQAATVFTGRPFDDFYDDTVWPMPFAKQWWRAKTKKGKAQAAANYIDWIIKNGKVR